MYEYKAKLIRVVDGDTLDFSVDLGFGITVHERFRLQGVDTPELRRGSDEDKKKAREAADYVSWCLDGVSDILIRTQKADGFGRWLADVVFKSNGFWYDLGSLLLDKGLAKVYESNR